MPSIDHVIIFGAGLLAGAINSVAGGGTLITFPILLWLGRDPILANATNALSLWPGSLAGAYALRREAMAARYLLRWLLPTGVVGSLIGGLLLLATPSRVFSDIVPFLVLVATLLIAAQRPLKRWLPSAPAGEHAADLSNASTTRTTVLIIAQLIVSIYGGYFGAAGGILMLAAYGLFGVHDIHQRNGIKNVLATVNNGIASIVFVAAGAINWSDALVLSVSAVLGGYVGGSLSRKLSHAAVEWIVVVIGLSATLTLALR